MVFNATFNNILAISWWSVLLMDGTGGTQRKSPTCRKSLQPLSHKVVSSTPHHEQDSNS